MSVVTTVVLFCHGEENLDTIRGWLSSHGMGELQLLSDCFGGSKRPEIQTYGAAYNMLDDRGFVELFLSLRWEINEEVLLVIRPQDSGVLTYRPLPRSRLSVKPNRVGS